MDHFELIAPYSSTGDQPEAIAKLTEGVENGLQEQVLLGVTGSGKTFTMANVIANVNRPTLVLAHNKTLAAQLCSEFREFFPNNAVEYFVSYYDYYQPEAYVPGKDVYIEKDSAVNAEIDKLRHSATSALFERRTSSSSPQSPASFRSATRRNTASRCFRCARGCTSRASSSSSVWSECSTAAATSASTAEFPRARRRGGDFPLQRGQRRGAR